MERGILSASCHPLSVRLFNHARGVLALQSSQSDVDEKGSILAERSDPQVLRPHLRRLPAKSHSGLVITIVHPRPVSLSQTFAGIVA